MLQFWSLLAVLILQLRYGVQGYMIDADCGDDTQFIEDRIDAAFRLIDNTVTELNRNPINAQIDDWHNTLFGRRFDITSESGRKIKTHFDSLIKLRTRTDDDRTSADQEGVTDVRFYCTVNRVEKKDGKYRNKDRNIDYKPRELGWPGGRYANCFDLLPPALMITMTKAGGYSEIQFCPWFLSNIRQRKFKDLSSFGESVFHLLSKVAIPAMAKLWYTPIDSFSLLDKMIVHELTHTDQIGLPTEDLSSHPYGFKNAQKMAANWVQNNQKPNPIRNADSNALFAVGTWIIAKGGGPINANGEFAAPQATPKART